MTRGLFVDDDNLFRQVLGMVLKWHTDLKETIEADSLPGARRVLGDSNHTPDLAVVDLDLANGDGFKLIEELRTDAPEVPVLAITLGRDVERRERALRAGAREVLTMAAPPKLSGSGPVGFSCIKILQDRPISHRKLVLEEGVFSEVRRSGVLGPSHNPGYLPDVLYLTAAPGPNGAMGDL